MSNPHSRYGPRNFVDNTTAVYVDDGTTQRSARRYAMSHTQNSRLNEEKIAVEPVPSKPSVASYADGFSENPLTGLPAKKFVPFQKDPVAGMLQVPAAVYGGDLSSRSFLSCNSLIERPAQYTAVREQSRSMANSLSAEALTVSQTHKRQLASRGQPGQDLPASLRPGRSATRPISVENPRPVSRDTHKMVVGSGDGWNAIADTVASTLSRGKSASYVNAGPHPTPAGHSQKGKPYIPAFLKPRAKATHRHEPTNEGVDAKQDKAANAAFWEPGWSEAPRKPLTVGKNHAATLSVTGIGQCHDELHLSELVSENKPASSDISTSEKMKNMRRAWSRAWKKRNRNAESSTEPAANGAINAQEHEACALTAVDLAQSGPASIVGGAVFPRDVVVTPSSRTPYQAGIFVGDAKVSVNDLPSMLRLGHGGNGVEGQHEASPTYKWPFVDTTNELFLNYDPKKDNSSHGRTRGVKHQEPRIVDLDLPKNSLGDEVLRDLAKRELGNGSCQSKVIPPVELEINFESGSPICPMSAEHLRIDVAKEMAIGGGSGLSILEAREVHFGPRNKTLGTEMTNIRTPEAPSPIRSTAVESIPVLPLATQDEPAKDSDQPDFSWFRFSRVDLEDPADQHCRDYRARRREMRRSKQAAWLVHAR
ncbi:uncharacterized protein A1O9_04439 [Exophiala aquamarina CBS 119918]|uniref:Uncharacterized protein n=1 Tax=Exophiala aquamarina CBS 119918 TaxID=1182545 RepID=A0A072PJU1_9EURO|nr:uncharacterized protein A1O9_04439 [Exophiala aquamarina CBS 119918]KEF59593.1 hypothetical protein A1O9_04439 [Exophiala aquamarina CBS 119918]